MTAITNAPRAPWASANDSAAPLAPSPQPPAEASKPAAVAASGSIEELGRQLLEETNAARCVAYRRSRSGQLIWQYEVAADAAAIGGPLAELAAANARAAVQVTRPVRDAFGEIIGVIQTRESSDPTF